MQAYDSARREDVLFGRIAVKNGLATQEQVEQGLAEQERAHREGAAILRLGEILVQRGLMTPSQSHAVSRASERLTPSATAASLPATASSESVQETARRPDRRSSASGLAAGAGGRFLVEVVQERVGTNVSEAEWVVHVIRVAGSLDLQSFPVLERTLNDLIEGGQGHLVISMAQLQYISSSGLGVLIASNKRARDLGGDLRLACVPDRIRAVMDVLGYTERVKHFDTEKAALMSFKYL
ncbi:MAG: anti-sigma factor antagonist [Planctomycetes bacterium]|nr:anti-sigma factor antagonist [Planctomycetota bacterium]